MGGRVGDSVVAAVVAGFGVWQRRRVSPGAHGRRVLAGPVLAIGARVAAPVGSEDDNGATDTQPTTRSAANGSTDRMPMALLLPFTAARLDQYAPFNGLAAMVGATATLQLGNRGQQPRQLPDTQRVCEAAPTPGG